MISFSQRGNFKKTEKFLKKSMGSNWTSVLERYGRMGVQHLSDNTPKDTGLTAHCWRYKIVRENGKISVVWENTNVNKGVNIALILQYGHGTRTGGYVQGRDYINPSLQPIFDKMADAAWKEVTGT